MHPWPRPGSKTAHIVEALKRGARGVDIARECNCSQPHISHVRAQMIERQRGLDLTVHMSGDDAVSIMTLEAARRNIHVNVLAERVLCTIAQDRLFAAVLDQ